MGKRLVSGECITLAVTPSCCVGGYLYENEMKLQRFRRAWEVWGLVTVKPLGGSYTFSRCLWETNDGGEFEKGLLGLECGWSEPLANFVVVPPLPPWTAFLEAFAIPHGATCRATS